MKKWALATVFVILAACGAVGGTGSREGDPCYHQGDVRAHGGVTLVCKPGPGRGEWTWQR